MMLQRHALQQSHPGPIRTIISDLGGVYFTDGTPLAIATITKQCNIPVPQIYDILEGELGSQYRRAQISAQEFWNIARERLPGVDVQQIRKIWLESYRPDDQVVALYGRLRHSGYELLFLSDNVQERVDYLDAQYKFREHFKDGIFSHIVRVRKPDPRIYAMVLQKTTSPPQQCVFIDNKPQHLIPAMALGMHALQFVNVDQLEKDLKKLGISWS